MSKEYKLPKQPELPKVEFCDRCGNDLSHGVNFMHLPFRKRYIAFCNICLYGLWLGFRQDLKIHLEETKS